MDDNALVQIDYDKADFIGIMAGLFGMISMDKSGRLEKSMLKALEEFKVDTVGGGTNAQKAMTRLIEFAGLFEYMCKQGESAFKTITEKDFLKDYHGSK